MYHDFTNKKAKVKKAPALLLHFVQKWILAKKKSRAGIEYTYYKPFWIPKGMLETKKTQA